MEAKVAFFMVQNKMTKSEDYTLRLGQSEPQLQETRNLALRRGYFGDSPLRFDSFGIPNFSVYIYYCIS